MSSAALQSAPHQPTTVGSHSPVPASSSNRPYSSGNSQSRDAYYTQSPASNASPSSTRRPVRRSSGNGASANNQQPQYYSPSGSSPINGAALSGTRGTASPVAPAAAPAAYPVSSMAPGDHHRGVPPVVSPRSSSNRSAAHAAASAATDRSSRRGYTNDALASPRQTGDGQQERADRQRNTVNVMPNGAGEDPALAAASAASRSRRRAQQEQSEPSAHRPSGSREQRPSHTGQRQPHLQQAVDTASPNSISREASEILNRVVISKPEVDIDRERERMAEAVPSSPSAPQTQGSLSIVPSEGVDDGGRSGRSRQDHSSSNKREKHSKFGDYYLGNTLGEGEFGKVKMGWKQEGGVQVAIKLIRRDSVGTNPTRLAKIYREIAILREISHPNIVRLHEMVETEKQIGIILEYASGGELFDYILNHRYLKDNAARRLFAQLVSGVGYLHKKGIVHRDLKLENLLLDRNRNIIITDFGFANTFNPDDELGDDIEYNLSSREYVKRMELDKILPNGTRRGDLMQTSCGSPCYAAPELVVSDSLYTGRKVDVWSCGVILYAMLAGYLPFDDDPANPEGDNINLLYKYIVSTPLTFPEYVTPHARDLLRRILVPDPRKRADLFEVARHSWLSEYSHVVGFITSSTTSTGDISSAHVGSEDQQEAPLLTRSASVREPSKAPKPSPVVGGLASKHGNVDQEATEAHPKPSKDNKRRTVQVEYVAPRSQTQRGDSSTATAPSVSRTRARAGSQGPVEVPADQAARRQASVEKPLPSDPPRDAQYGSQGRRPPSAHRQQVMPPPSRPGRDPPRAVSDTSYLPNNTPPVSMARPNTGGSMTSNNSKTAPLALPHRGSYSQPVAPAVAGTNAHGRISQPPPKTSKHYNISGPMIEDEELGDYNQPNSNRIPSKFARVSGFHEPPRTATTPTSAPVPEKGHKRSSTIGGLFSRTNSIFGKSGRHASNADQQQQEKPKKSYPPVSMSGAVGQGQTESSRQSMDSGRRSFSLGFGKKRSGSISGSQTSLQGPEKSRRFSLLPASFSLKAIGIGKEYGTPGAPPEGYDSRPDSRGPHPDQQQPPTTGRSEGSRNISGATTSHQYPSDSSYDRQRDTPVQDRRKTTHVDNPKQHQRYASQPHPQRSLDPRAAPNQQYPAHMNFPRDQSALTTESESSLNDTRNRRGQNRYPEGFNEYETPPPRVGTSSSQHYGPSQGSSTLGRSNGRGVLQKNNRRFTEAYEGEQHTGHGDSAGSSGAARKVMDFFRRRGRDRGT